MTTKKKTKRWKPKVGEEYWFVDTTGIHRISRWYNDLYDKYRYKFGNVFQTEEQAIAAAEKIKALLRSLCLD